MQDLEFDEGYSYQEIEITIEDEPFFAFPKLDLFTDSTFNTFIRKKEKLHIALLTPFTTHPKIEDNNDSFSSSSSDNNFSSY